MTDAPTENIERPQATPSPSPRPPERDELGSNPSASNPPASNPPVWQPPAVGPPPTKPVHVVITCLIAFVLAGVCLLTCGPNAAIEGAKDWAEESVLRAIVHVLNLGYTQTTAQGVEIKALVFTVGAALAAAVLAVSTAAKSPYEQAESDIDSDFDSADQAASGASTETSLIRTITPVQAAQCLLIAYCLWSFLSASWSTAPDLALGGSLLLAIGVIWSVAVGQGLGPTTTRVAAAAIPLVAALTAAMAVAYYDQRNPTRRAAYPLGNPLFLAAALIPGLLLSIALAGAAVQTLIRKPRTSLIRTFLIGASAVAAAALIIWAIRLTESRSAAVGFIAGLICLGYFVARKRIIKRLAGVLLLIALAATAFIAYRQLSAPSATGRDASLRLRMYAWSGAVDLIEQATLIGKGQGAFTQFGDAAAARNDAIDDPLALKDRIAHAHNEWLEVWVNLGAVGFVLVIAALVTTLWAGSAAISAADDPRDRWIIAGLLASIIALAVEQCADVALRIPGLPTIFFTLIGISFAAARNRGPGLADRLSRRRAARSTLALAWAAAAVVLLVVGVNDFTSARADYRVVTALAKRDFDRAQAYARTAAAHRLSPARRLEAIESACGLHLYLAREFQTSAFNRYARAQQSDPPDPNLLALYQDDRKISENHIRQATGAFLALVQRAPDYYGSGWLEYRLYQLRGAFADLDQDETLNRKCRDSALAAVTRELKRKPFDPLVALTAANLLRDRAPLAQRLDVLARPLRYAAFPPEYVDFLLSESSQPGFDVDFPYLSAAAQPEIVERIGRDDPLVPEKLRIAANISFLRGHYGDAVALARQAIQWYDWRAPQRPIGAAAARFELADYIFFLDPTDTKSALAHAAQAIALLPDSTPGRQLKRAVEDRIVKYQLAAGEEGLAKRALKRAHPDIPENRVPVEIGRRYAAMCRSVLAGRPRAEIPNRFDLWVQRALELAPDDELPYRLAAQRAYDRNEFAAAASLLRQALDRGAAFEPVLGFVNLALSEHPGNEPFKSLLADLKSAADNQRPASPGVPGIIPQTNPAPSRDEPQPPRSR